MELRKIYNDNSTLVKAFAESRIGGRAENQDSYGWCDTKHGYVVTVCDGMGGGPGGKTASEIAVREILSSIKEADDQETKSNILIKAVRNANMAVIDKASEVPALQGMGSTATVLLVNEDAAYIAHSGDSRVYQLRGHKKVFRTFDHSMVFEMVEQGVISEEQARLSAQSNVITKALGIKSDLEVSVVELPYERNDRFVLCSDGIHGSMPEKELIALLTDHKNTLGVVADNLCTHVDNLGRNAGGNHDNLTMAIVETKNNSKIKQPMSTKVKYMFIGMAIALLVSLVLNIVILIKHGNQTTACDMVNNNDSLTVNVGKDTINRDNAKTPETETPKTDSISKK